MMRVTAAISALALGAEAISLQKAFEKSFDEADLDGPFKAVKQKKSWNDARAACKKMGKNWDLAVLEKGKNKDAAKALKSAKIRDAWIGASDRKKEGNWVWVNGDAMGKGKKKNFKYTDFEYSKKWAGGEPNDHSGEDCGMMWVGRKKWNDDKCGKKMHFLCGKKVASKDVPPTSKSGFVAHDDKKTWADARKTCQAEGLDLAVIEADKDAEASALLKSAKIKGGAWIGLDDKKVEGQWNWVNTDPSGEGKAKKFKYSDLPYAKNWKSGEPNDAGKKEDCAEMWAGKKTAWNDNQCKAKRAFLCGPIVKTKVVHPESKWKVNKSAKTWDQAAEACKKANLVLAIPQTAAENGEIAHEAKKAGINDMWIGLSDKKKEGKWQWINGDPSGEGKKGNFKWSKLEYAQNWAKGEPNDHAGKEDCAEMWVKRGGQWNDNQCAAKRAYVCGPMVPSKIKREAKEVKVAKHVTKAGKTKLCPDYASFEVAICKSHACTECGLSWCFKQCNETYKEKYASCRCKSWPESRQSFSSGDKGRGGAFDKGDYRKH